MSDCTSQNDNLFHQLTLNSALTDALMVLYNTNKSDNEYINKFLQLYKPICQKINQTKVSVKSFEPILDKPFAKGAFGKVTIVKSTADQLVYAMKIIKKSRLISQMDRATPMEERLILSHPNEEWLPRLHASFQDDRHLYLVMEYTPGGDLGGLIDRKQVVFTEDVARFYIAELILAIERVHQLGYMHRDIKPGNILIDKTGHIKLGDLGSCIAVDTEEPLSMVGTAFYMSPEMFNACGNTKRDYSAYGKEVDWWSVGVVLYELLVISNSGNASTTMKCQYKPLSLKDLKSSIENDPKTTLSHEAKDLILRLLSTSTDRLGYNGVDEIKSHHFFKSIDWNIIHSEEKPPFIPEITSIEDTKYFSESYEKEERYSDGSDSDDDSDDDSIDYEEEDNDLAHEFPFIGYTFTETFTGKLTKKVVDLINKNPQKTEEENLKINDNAMKERIQLLEKENKTLLKVNQQQTNDLNELYPLKEQVKQLQKECQTLLDERTNFYNSFENNSKELEKIKLQLEKEKQGSSLKEQQWLKQLATLKNSLKNQSHQNEHLIKLKEENNSLLGKLKESRNKIDTLRNELEENKKRFEMLHDSKPKDMKPKIKNHPVEEDRSAILTAMWERDQQLLKMLQNELNSSQDKLSKSKLQVIRLKKEIQHFQKSKLERQKSITKTKKRKQNSDTMEGPLKLSFDSSNYRSFYLKLQNGMLEILDEQNRNSQSILDLRSMLSSVTLSQEGILAIRTKEHSQSVQSIQNQIKREKDIMSSTQCTLAARARLNRKKNEIDHELERTLKRALESISLLEKELKEKRNHVLVPSSDVSLSCCRCVSEKQGISTCQNCHHAFHPDCASSAPDCINYQELMVTVPLLLKTNNNNETMKWYHAIKISISSENPISHCI